MKKKIISLFLILILIFSCAFGSHAETKKTFNEVTLSMYCNVSGKTSISGVYSENNFYIKAEDLCEITNGKIEEQSENSIVISCNYGIRKITIDHKTKNMTEETAGETSDRLITMPVIEYEKTMYYSLLHFLRYLGISVSLEKDAATQLKIYVQNNIFDILVECKEKNNGNSFWWDELEVAEGENLEDKLLNAGVIALVNRDSNLFRMMFDAEGIEREALENALVSILTNEGASYFDENNTSLDALNLANDSLGLSADVASFVVKSYKSDATAAFGEFIDDFSSTSATSVNFVINYLNAVSTMKQFDAIIETQRIILEKTILEHPENSDLLCGEWAKLHTAATNVNNRAKDAYENAYEMGKKVVSDTAYDFLQGEISGNPVVLAWNGAILINQQIPYTSNMIDKKTQLYNAYLCSMIQLIANELAHDAVADLMDADFMPYDSNSQYQHMTELKNAMILQLKSTLTTREYLIKSEFIEKSYAEEMKVMNKETAELLNKFYNCKIVLVGMDQSITEDLTWMESYESPDTLAFEMREEYFESKTSDGVLYCSNKISYPYFLGSSEVEKKINARYEQIINNYKASSEEDIDSKYESAIEYTESHKLPFYIDTEVTVSYNQNGYVSLLEYLHNWTGGAHPYHYETGLTYDIKTAQEVDYSRFFTGNTEDVKEFLSKKAIDYDPARYYYYNWYEDSQFVLTDDGICFYFWVGDAVPRVEIIIPYSDEKAPFIHISKDSIPQDLCGITDDLTLENGLLNYYGKKVSVPFCKNDDTIAYYMCDLNADSVQELIVKETERIFNIKYNTEHSSVHYHVYTYTDKVVYLNEIDNSTDAKLTLKEDGTGINVHYFLGSGYYRKDTITIKNNELVSTIEIPAHFVEPYPDTPDEIPFSSATTRDGYLAIE